MPVRYSCCREGEWLEDYNNWYDLNQLYFCAKCQRIKCWRCTQPMIKVKFCSRCLEKTSGNHCPKHCFNCPTCNRALKISSTTEPDGKSFKFDCKCGWSFNTGTIRQPQPLRRIIRTLNKENSPFYQLKAFYEGKGSLPEQREDVDSSLGKNKLPVLTRVKSKDDIYCRVCNSWLVVNSSDVSSAAKINSAAHRYVPEIYLDRSQDKLLLHFINNSKYPMDIEITHPSDTAIYFPRSKFTLAATGNGKTTLKTPKRTTEATTGRTKEVQAELEDEPTASLDGVVSHACIPIETQLQEFKVPIHVQISGQFKFGFWCLNTSEI